jgi:hypothetical protein
MFKNIGNLFADRPYLCGGVLSFVWSFTWWLALPESQEMVWRTVGVNLRHLLLGVILSALILGAVVGANRVRKKGDIFFNLPPMLGCYIATTAIFLTGISLFGSPPEFIILMFGGAFAVVIAIPVLLVGEILGKVFSSAV